jgi:hypothetical protein
MMNDELSGPMLWFHAENMMDDERSPQARLAALWAREDVGKAAAMGIFVTFVSAAVEQMKDDNMRAVSDEMIEQWARWESTPGAGAKALRAVLQGKNGLLDWDMLRPWVRRTDPYATPDKPRLRPRLR